MKLVIDIDMDNAAFEESGTEAARILRNFADLIEGQDMSQAGIQPLFDLNGNKVGKAKVNV